MTVRRSPEQEYEQNARRIRLLQSERVGYDMHKTHPRYAELVAEIERLQNVNHLLHIRR